MTAPLDASAIDNPYWDAVRHLVVDEPIWGGPTVGGISSWRASGGHPGDLVDTFERRRELVGRYAWTITDPDTAAFVAEHAQDRAVDPIAGSGYWGYVLGQLGVDVVSYDVDPPSAGRNHYHKEGREHVEVRAGDALHTVARHPDRTLLLAWPPYSRATGAATVNSYGGGRVIYIGEGPGGCCGDDDLFTAFDSDWKSVAEHWPVQWDGIHDRVTVYDRRGAL